MIGEEESEEFAETPGAGEEPTETPAPGAGTADMDAAVEAARAASPELSRALDEAGVTPEGLRDAHDTATGSEGVPGGE